MGGAGLSLAAAKRGAERINTTAGRRGDITEGNLPELEGTTNGVWVLNGLASIFLLLDANKRRGLNFP